METTCGTILRLRTEGWSEARILSALGHPGYGEEFAHRVLERTVMNHIYAPGTSVQSAISETYRAGGRPWSVASSPRTTASNPYRPGTAVYDERCNYLTVRDMVARLLVAIEQGTAAAEHDAVAADLRAFDGGGA